MRLISQYCILSAVVATIFILGFAGSSLINRNFSEALTRQQTMALDGTERLLDMRRAAFQIEAAAKDTILRTGSPAGIAGTNAPGTNRAPDQDPYADAIKDADEAFETANTDFLQASHDLYSQKPAFLVRLQRLENLLVTEARIFIAASKAEVPNREYSARQKNFYGAGRSLQESLDQALAGFKTDADALKRTMIKKYDGDLIAVWAVCLLFVCATLLFGGMAVRGMTQRLQALSHGAGRLADGDLTARIDEDAGGEIGEINRILNRMAGKLETANAELVKRIGSRTVALHNALRDIDTLREQEEIKVEERTYQLHGALDNTERRCNFLETVLERKSKNLSQAQDAVSTLNNEFNQRLQAVTAQLRDEQQALILSLERLLMTISHELRTPVGTLRTVMFMIDHKVKTAGIDMGSSMERAQQSIGRCDEIVSDLIDFTGSPEGDGEIPPIEIVDLDDPEIDPEHDELLALKDQQKGTPLPDEAGNGEENTSLENIRQALEEVSARNQTLEMHSRDQLEELQKAREEITTLSDGLEERVKERTAELEGRQQEMVRAERLSALSQLAAAVGHELRLPLGALRTSLFMVQSKTKGKDLGIESAVDRADRSISRCDNLIDEMLDFAETADLETEVANIDEWLDGVIESYQEADLEKKIVVQGVRVEREAGSPDIMAALNMGRMERAVINVFENGCQSMAENPPEKDRLMTISAQVEGDRVGLCFTDTGEGMDERTLAKIFEPLYTTRSLGVGLGMSIIKQIVEQHGGSIDVESAAGVGTSVILWVPIAQAAGAIQAA